MSSERPAKPRKRMGRPPVADGPPTPVTVTLGQTALAELDRRAVAHGGNRSAVINALLTPRTLNAAAVAEVGCAHRQSSPLSGGLRRCKGCGAVQGLDRAWRIIG